MRSFLQLLAATLSALLVSAAPQVGLLTDTNGTVLRSGFWATNMAGISNALALNGYLKASAGSGINLTLASTTLSGDTLLSIGSTDRVLALDDNGYLVSLGVTRAEAGHLSGVTAALQGQINAKSAWLAFPTNYFTVTSSTNITLKAHGVSTLVNVTAGDFQDLASFGVFDAAYPTRVRVLRDDSGRLLGSGRWFVKATTDGRTPDGKTIILPIDVPSEASPGRWVLEGEEE